MAAPFYKIIACEIAFREISHAVARSPSVVDLEFLPQGLHDDPRRGRVALQKAIDAADSRRYDAILVGYGLCGNLLAGVRAPGVPLVIPRAHDCITFFLGSKERHRRLNAESPETYFFTSGWIECSQRRTGRTDGFSSSFLPAQADFEAARARDLELWTRRYGPEKARYLLETMDQWTRHYTSGALIDFDFTRSLNLKPRVQAICNARGWTFKEEPGDLGLLQRWIDGVWNQEECLVVAPGERVEPSYRDDIIRAVASSDSEPPK